MTDKTPDQPIRFDLLQCRICYGQAAYQKDGKFLKVADVERVLKDMQEWITEFGTDNYIEEIAARLGIEL